MELFDFTTKLSLVGESFPSRERPVIFGMLEFRQNLLVLQKYFWLQKKHYLILHKIFCIVTVSVRENALYFCWSVITQKSTFPT